MYPKYLSKCKLKSTNAFLLLLDFKFQNRFSISLYSHTNNGFGIKLQLKAKPSNGKESLNFHSTYQLLEIVAYSSCFVNFVNHIMHKYFFAINFSSYWDNINESKYCRTCVEFLNYD